jgi:RNA polymerase sigma-70 factor (ECF subfamily)
VTPKFANPIEGFGAERPIAGVTPAQSTLPGTPSTEAKATLLAPRLRQLESATELGSHAEARASKRALGHAGEDSTAKAQVQLDFNAIYTTYFHSVSRWVRAFGGLSADVDDLTQEVFLVVERRIDSFQGGNMAAWLYGIARRTVRDHRRKAWFRRWLSGADPELADAGHETPDPSVSFERREAQRLVAVILQEMSAVRRTTFVLFEIEGYSGEEIALLESVPVNTVYTRLHHARKDFFRLMAARLQTGEEP